MPITRKVEKSFIRRAEKAVRMSARLLTLPSAAYFVLFIWGTLFLQGVRTYLVPALLFVLLVILAWWKEFLGGILLISFGLLVVITNSSGLMPRSFGIDTSSLFIIIVFIVVPMLGGFLFMISSWISKRGG